METFLFEDNDDIFQRISPTINACNNEGQTKRSMMDYGYSFKMESIYGQSLIWEGLLPFVQFSAELFHVNEQVSEIGTVRCCLIPNRFEMTLKSKLLYLYDPTHKSVESLELHPKGVILRSLPKPKALLQDHCSDYVISMPEQEAKYLISLCHECISLPRWKYPHNLCE